MSWDVKTISTYVLMLITPLAVVNSLSMFNNVFLTFFIYYILLSLVAPGIILFFVQKLTFKEALAFLGFSKPKLDPGMKAGLALGSFLFTSMIIGAYLLAPTFLANSDINETIDQWGISGAMMIPMAIAMLIFNGAAEEVFWRGFIQKNMDHINIWARNFFITILFTSYHIYVIQNMLGILPVTVMFIALIFCMGFVWGWMRYYFDSIWPPLISHVFVTAGYLVIYLWML